MARIHSYVQEPTTYAHPAEGSPESPDNRHARDGRPNGHPVVPSRGFGHDQLTIDDEECVWSTIGLIGRELWKPHSSKQWATCPAPDKCPSELGRWRCHTSRTHARCDRQARSPSKRTPGIYPRPSDHGEGRCSIRGRALLEKSGRGLNK